MLLSPLRLSYSQDYLSAGFKELQLPANPGFAPDTWDREAFQIDNDCLHIWPRGDFMLIALPDPGGTFTMTRFLDHESKQESAETFAKLKTGADVKAFFEKHFPDVVPLMPNLEEDFFDGPVGELCTVKASPWHYEDKAALLGDAAHAVVPFFGQGMNCGFEDCRVLMELIDADTGDDWGAIFDKYTELREENGKAIADLAVYNYWEMRDRVADPEFLLRKKVEAKISKMYGDKYTPLYSMVTFSHMPYAEAKRLGEDHEEMMKGLMGEPGFHEKWDSLEGETLIEGAMAARGIERPS
jgi:kynurenine 3-monooxygenase